LCHAKKVRKKMKDFNYQSKTISPLKKIKIYVKTNPNVDEKFGGKIKCPSRSSWHPNLEIFPNSTASHIP